MGYELHGLLAVTTATTVISAPPPPDADGDAGGDDGFCVQVRSFSPRAASEPEPCSPTPPQSRVAQSNIVGDRRVPYSDGECSLAHGRTVSPPPPAPAALTDMMMDRAMQSSLPSLTDEHIDSINARRFVFGTHYIFTPPTRR